MRNHHDNTSTPEVQAFVGLAEPPGKPEVQAAAVLPELLTTEQAAALCGISTRHFESLAAAGKVGPVPVRLGRAVRWPRAELVAWCRAGCPGREKWLAEQSPERARNAKTARNAENAA